MNNPPKQGLYDPQFEHDACGVGFIVDIQGRKSHRIVEMAVQALVHMDHRGASGCDKNSGDGAGLLIQIPHRFLASECEKLKIELPADKQYGVGMVFLPIDVSDQNECVRSFEEVVRQEGHCVLGWRDVPTDSTLLGPTAKAAQPVIKQIFINRCHNTADDLAFERKLYVIRKQIEKRIKQSAVPSRDMFYIPSLSQKTIVYKGMLNPNQLLSFYPDLANPLVETALAMLHSRFSTNTFPSWLRAHPNRYLAHNGEINTLRGNVNWMRAREKMFASELFGEDMEKVLPVIDTRGSDSSQLDNVLELLTLAGRKLPHAVMMMIPEPWSKHESMSREKKAFYEYHACLMEPWDGPASIAFTDGTRIGAVLDRNGLRPSRYYVTKDDLVIMASEVGVLDIPPGDVVLKGRLQPGRMFLVDTEERRIVSDTELKQQIASEQDYAGWLEENLVPLENIPSQALGAPSVVHRGAAATNATLLQLQHAFGYTVEDLKQLMSPMAAGGNEAVGSMGTDTPLAVLSHRPQLLYNYFKQLFAQVTNPPVDAIREELVMSMETTIGPEGNLLE
ncbi:MAG: glutamate synthase subunit alpha, partial [Pyrinomonadaceae bacterium]|nr:glutamate synthase subunit alpha [Pyrinomonadaceae bacterium]